MDAFLSATHISVQQVQSVDEMRINDSDLKKKWSTVEKDMIEVSQLRLAAVNKLAFRYTAAYYTHFLNLTLPSINKHLLQCLKSSPE